MSGSGSAATRTCAAPALLAVTALLALLAAGPSDAKAAAGWRTSPWLSWQATLLREHPLVGRIRDTAAGAWITPEVLAERLAAADLALLGETHDNPDHHRLQAWMIAAMVAAGHHPAVVLEMLSAEQAADLRRIERLRPLAPVLLGAPGLGRLLRWKERGWPDWSIYRPIAEAAISAGLPILPGDAARSALRRLRADGETGLDFGMRERIGGGIGWSGADEAALRRELADSHCGMLPEAAMPKMSLIQRFRDASLADSLIQAANVHGGRAVLVAGGGHVQKHRGVPRHLAAAAPGRKAVSVILAEVVDSEREPEAAVPVDANGQPLADYVWFTPAAERPDPCEGMRASGPPPAPTSPPTP